MSKGVTGGTAAVCMSVCLSVCLLQVASCAELRDQWVKAVQDSMSVAGRRLDMQRQSIVSWYSPIDQLLNILGGKCRLAVAHSTVSDDD